MRILKQSPALREAFQKQVNQKISNQEQLPEDFRNSFLGFVFEMRQFKNQVKGTMGEEVVSLFLASNLPDSWVMFQNALIPGAANKTLTEIDHLIVGPGGIFLAEIKTWEGSFSAYKDKWKKRERHNWIAMSNSPTSQSAYHQKMFDRWIASQVPNLPKDAIVAPVVFTVAKWIGTTDCSVPVLHGIKTLLEMLVNSENCLTPEQVLMISEAVEDYAIPVPDRQIPKPIIKPKTKSEPQQ